MALINKTGITNGGTIQAEHVTRAIDALSGGSTDSVIATGSFTGSFKGDGSQLTGITGEWDGSLIGDALITGKLSVTAGVTASLQGTASWATNAISANTASYVLNAVSASYAVSSSFATLATSASSAATASFLNTLNQTQVTINGTASISDVTYYPNITYNDLTVGTEITVLTIPITNYYTTTIEIIAAAGVTSDVTNISSTLGGNLIGAAKRDSGGVSIMGQTSSSFRSGFTNDTRFGLSAGSGVINVWVRSESLATRWTLGVKSITVFNPIP